MSALSRFSIRVFQFNKNFGPVKRSYSSFRNTKYSKLSTGICVCAVGGGALLYVAHVLGKFGPVHAFKPKKVSNTILYISTAL